MPKLRREGIGRGATSWIQNYLVDILYDKDHPTERQNEWQSSHLSSFISFHLSPILSEVSVLTLN